MRLGIFLLLLISLAFSKPVLLVVDASGSMNDPLETGEAKIDAAKTAAQNFVEKSSGSEIGVMQFSYCTDIYGPPDPLQGDVRIVEGFTTDKSALNDAIESIYAEGDTPIAYALEEAVAYFESRNKRDGIIVLLTDGEETCGGDPEAAAEAAYSQGYAVINVIAYDLDPSALEYAQRIARAGGGNVYTAETQQELESALSQATGSSFPCCFPLFLFGIVGFFVFYSHHKQTV